MINKHKASETLRQMALTKRGLSWLGGIAETVARLEEDSARKARDIEAYKRAAGWHCDGTAGGKRWTGERAHQVELWPEAMKIRWSKEANAT